MAEKEIPDATKPVPTELAQYELLEIISGRLATIRGITAERPQGACDHSLNITGLPDIPPCLLSVLDARTVRWEYSPEDEKQIDARRAADIVTALITDESGPYEKLADFSGSGTGFKGIVARELVARGLSVELEVLEDTKSFSASTDIVVTKKQASATNEDAASSGKAPVRNMYPTRAYVDDSGFIFCDSEYWGEVQAQAIAEDVAQRVERVVNTFAISGNSTIIRSEDE